MVVFNPDENMDSILIRASQEHTTLTAYFKANASSENLGVKACKYTYSGSQNRPNVLLFGTDGLDAE